MSEHTLAYVDNGSIIHRADSLSKLLWVLVIVIAAFTFHTSAARALMFGVLLFIAIFIARIPLRTILRASPLIFGVALLLGLFHIAVTKGTTPIAAIGRFVLTREALEDGSAYFFRLAITVLASFLLIWTTDIRDLMVGLVRLGMPYRFAFAIFMSLRFLPIIQNEVEAVRAAHAIRGRATKSQLSHRFRLWQRYMFTVIVNGLRKAENTATAIESRGFGAYPDRTYVKDFHWTATGILLVIAFAAFSAWLIYWEHIGRLK